MYSTSRHPQSPAAALYAACELRTTSLLSLHCGGCMTQRARCGQGIARWCTAYRGGQSARGSGGERACAELLRSGARLVLAASIPDGGGGDESLGGLL